MSFSAASSLSPRNTVAYQGTCTTPAMGSAHLRVDRSGALGGLAQALLLGADEDGDLASVLVVLHQLVGLRDAIEAQGTPQHRSDGARLDELVCLQALVGIGEVRAQDLLLLHPQVAHVEVQVEARGAGADDDLAERLDGEHRRGERGRADVLEDDVGGAAEDLLDRLAEPARLLEARLLLFGRLAALAHHPAELAAVDEALGAELLDQLALLVGVDDAHALGARGPADLRREDAQAARGAPDQDLLAGLQVAARHEHAPGGEVHEAVGRGLLPGQLRRLGQQLLGLDLGELRERAPRRLVAPDALRRRGHRVQAVDLGVLVGGLVAVDDDLVALLPARDARADLPDDARGVRAADVVAVLRVVAVLHDRHRLAERRPDVVVVDAGRHHADDDLEGAGLRYFDLLDLEGVLGLAEALLADDPGGHLGRQLPGLGGDGGDLRHVNGHVLQVPLEVGVRFPRGGANHTPDRVNATQPTRAFSCRSGSPPGGSTRAGARPRRACRRRRSPRTPAAC